jgi:hypothetical protein
MNNTDKIVEMLNKKYHEVGSLWPQDFEQLAQEINALSEGECDKHTWGLIEVCVICLAHKDNILKHAPPLRNQLAEEYKDGWQPTKETDTEIAETVEEIINTLVGEDERYKTAMEVLNEWRNVIATLKQGHPNLCYNDWLESKIKEG